jgi:hypothetical protein
MSPGPGGRGPGPQPIFPATPSNEPVNEFLVRRERELTQQIDALRGQIVPKEQERFAIRTAMYALGLLNKFEMPTETSLDELVGVPPSNSGHSTPNFPTFTIKQMALAALRDHFHKGATPSELRDYMKTAYGRDIDRNSIGPQLARLRDQGAVQQHNDGRWSITRGGKWYDRPTSFNASKDDEPPDDSEPSEEEVGRFIAENELLGKITEERAREILRRRRNKT